MSDDDSHARDRRDTVPMQAGVVVSLAKADEGKVRVAVDDVLSMDAGEGRSWVHRFAYTTLDYDATAFDEGRLSPDQLATLGLAVVTRLRAALEPPSEDGAKDRDAGAVTLTQTYPGFPRVK
jgi:hypothetical protein